MSTINDKSHITVYQYCKCLKQLTMHKWISNKLTCTQCKK